MGSTRALIFVTFAAAALPAAGQARITEIYKCEQPGSRSLLYTSDPRDTKGKRCELVSRQENTAPPQAPRAAAARPENFPKETPAQRARATDVARSALLKELATEDEGLALARKELADQQSVRTGEERNYAKVEERLQPFRDRVETHEKNIEALKRELGNIRR